MRNARIGTCFAMVVPAVNRASRCASASMQPLLSCAPCRAAWPSFRMDTSCARSVRWIELPILHGRNLGLDTGALSMLAYEHDNVHEPAIELWNAASNEVF